MFLSMSTYREGRALFVVCILRAVLCTLSVNNPSHFTCGTSVSSNGQYWTKEIELVGQLESPCAQNTTDLTVFIVKDHASNQRDISHLLICPSPTVHTLTLVFSRDILNVLKKGNVLVIPPCKGMRNVVQISMTTSQTEIDQVPEVHIFTRRPLYRQPYARAFMYRPDKTLDILEIMSSGLPGHPRRHFREKQRNHASKINSVVPRRRRDTTNESTYHFTEGDSCGNTHKCFRNGPPDCKHMECTYFVSYTTTYDNVVFELSAKTNGWVAIGFSSDKSMGGDDVIACLSSASGPDDIKVAAFNNPYAHLPPKKMETKTSIQILKGVMNDEYLYCKVKAPLTDTFNDAVDLSNDWYQLYAWGQIITDGKLEKHSQMPLISYKKIAIHEQYDYHTSSSGRAYNSTFIFIIISTVLYNYC